MNETCVFDIGLHLGEDTDFYLKKGYSVVAVEANPELIAKARVRFRDAIELGRLRLVEGAIAPLSAGAKVTFYTNTGHSPWGTVLSEWATRNSAQGFPSKRVEVSRIDVSDLILKYGMPFYIKIDIEGMDHLIIEQLAAFTERPQYISLESEKEDFSRLESEIRLVRSLGYTKFKVVQQADIGGLTVRAHTIDGCAFDYTFAPEASGPFGEEIVEPWLTSDEAIKEYRAIFRRYRYFGDHSAIQKMPKGMRHNFHRLYRVITGYRGPLPGWFDTHASL